MSVCHVPDKVRVCALNAEFLQGHPTDVLDKRRLSETIPLAVHPESIRAGTNEALKRATKSRDSTTSHAVVSALACRDEPVIECSRQDQGAIARLMDAMRAEGASDEYDEEVDETTVNLGDGLVLKRRWIITGDLDESTMWMGGGTVSSALDHLFEKLHEDPQFHFTHMAFVLKDGVVKPSPFVAVACRLHDEPANTPAFHDAVHAAYEGPNLISFVKFVNQAVNSPTPKSNAICEAHPFLADALIVASLGYTFVYHSGLEYVKKRNRRVSFGEFVDRVNNSTAEDMLYKYGEKMWQSLHYKRYSNDLLVVVVNEYFGPEKNTFCTVENPTAGVLYPPNYEPSPAAPEKKLDVATATRVIYEGTRAYSLDLIRGRFVNLVNFNEVDRMIPSQQRYLLQNARSAGETDCYVLVMSLAHQGATELPNDVEERLAMGDRCSAASGLLYTTLVNAIRTEGKRLVLISKTRGTLTTDSARDVSIWHAKLAPRKSGNPLFFLTSSSGKGRFVLALDPRAEHAWVQVRMRNDQGDEFDVRLDPTITQMLPTDPAKRVSFDATLPTVWSKRVSNTADYVDQARNQEVRPLDEELQPSLADFMKPRLGTL